MSDKNSLIAYFSASGQTKRLAQTIAQVTGGQLYEIVPQERYTPADLDWHNGRSRSSLEMNDKASRPAIAGPKAPVEEADTVFIGFPIWWYEAPRIIQTFLESYDFAGKRVIPFATSGGSGMGKTDAILKVCCPQASWVPGRRMSSTERPESIKNWINSLEKK